MSDQVSKRTPLYEEHVRLGGKVIDFGGWALPVQYTSITDEHESVRNGVGVFDISHMGEFSVHGSGSEAWLNRMLTNNVSRLSIGEGQYTLLLNPNGGVIDDLLIYRLSEDDWLMVVNAAKIDEDFAWLSQHLPTEGVRLENDSDNVAAFAIQGPRSQELFEAFFGTRYTAPARNHILYLEIDGMPYYIARTGYTGEDGFEVFSPAERAVKSWTDILRKGAPFGIKPCGLGARDTLRLEVCYPLNGSDLSPERSPLEAGLGFFVDLDKPDFIGRDILVQQKAAGIESKLVPFKMLGQAPPPRPHYPIFAGGTQVSEITSGTMSPSLKIGVGMAYVPVALAKPGQEIEIDIRGRRFNAIVEKKPLYRRAAKA